MTTTESKIALVTGGSRGLGKNMALNLAENGIDVVLTYHTSKEKAEETVDKIKSIGQDAAAFQLDTANIDEFDGFLDKVTTYLKELTGKPNFDFLINNAGTSLHEPFAKTKEEQFDQIINVHLKGVFFLTQKVLLYLNDGGRIINISSGLARFSMSDASVYGSVKGAVEVLTRYQATELGERHITANAVAPGAIETDFSGGMVRDNEEVNVQVASMTALGRAGLPEDIGGVVAFLCTEDARWINGQRIEVSGGMNL